MHIWGLTQFLYFTIIKMMDTKAIYNYFEMMLDGNPEQLAVLSALMDINGDSDGIIDFIDYYGYDIDELNEDIQEFYNNNKLY